MKFHSQLLLSLLLCSASATADIRKASELLSEGKPADALEQLHGDPSPEAAFWRGRALIALDRLKEAADILLTVPQEHALYPYAAKGLLYCAWKSKRVDFASIATPMATCKNQEIATLATAALAEYWLRQPQSQDNSALERLRKLSETQTDLKPLLQILEVDNLRLRGEYDNAINLCRELENNTQLSSLMRQRVRLSLSDVYYAKEAAAAGEKKEEPLSAISVLPIISSAQEAAQTQYDDGKGEETLLHFISTHPDSPLLEEAFRRLQLHGAFENSEYARTKLKEWMMDPLKTRRAATALLIQQHLINPENALEIPLDVTCANTAAATCPNEPATHLLLLEQTRWFLERGQTHEALLYLGMVQQNDVFKQFYETQLHAPEAPSTAKAYLECARIAPASLRPAALLNALLCALMSGETAIQETVLNMPDISEELHFRLLQARAAYYLDKDPQKAQADIDILMTQQAPSPGLMVDVEMDRAYLHMQRDPAAALELLSKSSIESQFHKLTNAQQLRYFALQEEALRRNAAHADEAATPQVMELIRGAASKVRSPQVVAVLTLHLASLQSSLGLHVDALRTLDTLVRKYTKSDFAPRALYMAGRESEAIGTENSLKRALELYETCASRSEALAVKASARRAAVLLRLGQHEESEHLLTHLLRSQENLRPEDKAMIKATLANNKALLGTDEGRKEAVRLAGLALEDTQLPRWWRFRVLLHHASLCERAGMFEQALRDYEEVLAMKPAMDKKPGKADWHILYSAGSGAVMQLFYLKRYADAADMADQIANWNKTEADQAKHKQFANWASFIRQTNFVSESALPF